MDRWDANAEVPHTDASVFHPLFGGNGLWNPGDSRSSLSAGSGGSDTDRQPTPERSAGLSDTPERTTTPKPALQPASAPGMPQIRIGSDAAASTANALKTRNVYVAALPMDITEAELNGLLAPFGNVQSCRIFNDTDRVAEIGRAYGFVLFETPSEAETAVAALDGKPYRNARLQCRLSRNGVVKKSPKDPRQVLPQDALSPQPPAPTVISPPPHMPLATFPPQPQAAPVAAYMPYAYVAFPQPTPVYPGLPMMSVPHGYYPVQQGPALPPVYAMGHHAPPSTTR